MERPRKPRPPRKPHGSRTPHPTKPRKPRFDAGATRAQPGKAPPLPGQTHWDNVSEWYDTLVGDQGSEYHQEVVLPGVLKLLELKEGERLLDVACGQGVLSRAVAAKGNHVTGVDAARGLIEAAIRRNKTERLPIRYVIGDALKLTENRAFAGASGGASGGETRFDAAACVLAIQNLTPLSPVWQGCRALLRDGGRLVVVMMHPAFRVPKASDWGWDERNGIEYRRIDAYLTSTKTPIQMHPGSAPDETTVTFHRPLQAYVNTLANAGFVVDRLEEWPSHKQGPPGRKREAIERARREIPMFLALRARALGAPSGQATSED